MYEMENLEPVFWIVKQSSRAGALLTRGVTHDTGK